jgi:Cu/Ag efflux pump CusA
MRTELVCTAWLASFAACSEHRIATTNPAGPSKHRTIGGDIEVVIRDPSLGAADLERAAAVPLERAMLGLPHLAHERTTIEPQRATVILELDREGDLLDARAEVIDRMRHLALPATSAYEIGPFARRDGVVLHYAVRCDALPLTSVRTWHDAFVRTRLLRTTGVADVATCATDPVRWRLRFDARRLDAAGIAIGDVASAISGARDVQSMEQLSQLVVATGNGVPIYLRDVAALDSGSHTTCFGLIDGKFALLGTVYAAVDADPAAVREATIATFGALRAEIPPSITISADDMPVPLELVTIAPPIAKLDTFVDAIHQISTLPGIAHVRAELGPADGGFPRAFPGEALVSIDLAAGAERGRAASLARDRLTQLGLPTFDAASPHVEILGPDLDVVSELATKGATAARVAAIGTARGPRTSFVVDWTAVARWGIHRGDVTDLLGYLAGAPLAAATIDGARVPITMNALDDPAALTVRAGDGARVPLSVIAQVHLGDEPIAIFRTDGRRWAGYHTISADAPPRIELPPGFDVRLGR